MLRVAYWLKSMPSTCRDPSGSGSDGFNTASVAAVGAEESLGAAMAGGVGDHTRDQLRVCDVCNTRANVQALAVLCSTVVNVHSLAAPLQNGRIASSLVQILKTHAAPTPKRYPC